MIGDNSLCAQIQNTMCAQQTHSRTHKEEGSTVNREALRTIIAKWFSNRFVQLDTETTGLGPDDEIIEIAITDMTGTPLINTLVRPTKPIPPEATEINGITDEMVAGAPTWLEVYPKVMAILRDKKFIAWNAGFDARMITQTAMIYGIYNHLSSGDVIREYRAIHDNYVDAHPVYSAWFGEHDKKRGGFKRQRLQHAMEQMEVTMPGDAHRALADCQGMHGVLMTVMLSETKTEIGRRFFYCQEEGEGVGSPDDMCCNLEPGDEFSLCEAVDLQEVDFIVEQCPDNPQKKRARRVSPEYGIRIEYAEHG